MFRVLKTCSLDCFLYPINGTFLLILLENGSTTRGSGVLCGEEICLSGEKGLYEELCNILSSVSLVIRDSPDDWGWNLEASGCFSFLERKAVISNGLHASVSR